MLTFAVKTQAYRNEVMESRFFGIAKNSQKWSMTRSKITIQKTMSKIVIGSDILLLFISITIKNILLSLVNLEYSFMNKIYCI